MDKQKENIGNMVEQIINYIDTIYAKDEATRYEIYCKVISHFIIMSQPRFYDNLAISQEQIIVTGASAVHHAMELLNDITEKRKPNPKELSEIIAKLKEMGVVQK